MKILIFLFFITSLVTAQSPGIICYNLTRGEMIEFQENFDLYTESIRGVLVNNGASFFSTIIQSGDTFIVNMIGLNVEDDVVFLYDSDKKLFKVSYTGPTGFIEKIISDVEIFRDSFTIKLNKFDTPFIIRFVDDVFENLGIRQYLNV